MRCFFPQSGIPLQREKGAMVLSIGELKDYCATEDSFKGCQFFKEIEPNKEKIESRDA
jgi:hypothetical protein